jgi:hypothetical protein
MITAMRLGIKVNAAIIAPDGNGGSCSYGETAPPELRAVIAVAAPTWISEFRRSEFPRGAVGVLGAWGAGSDWETAIRAVGDDVGLRRATDRAREILAEHRAELLAIADRIDRDGYVFGD